MSFPLPANFSLRSSTLDDVGIMLGLMQICDIAEFGRIRSTESDIRNFWKVPNYDAEKDSWLLFAPDGRLVAQATVGHQPPISQLYVGVRVHPDYTSSGLYEYMLDLVLERLRELVPEADEGVRVSAMTWCSQKNEQWRQVLEETEFTHVRSNWLMEINMDQPPQEPVWPEGLELRSYTPDLLHAVFEADNEVFRDHWGHRTLAFELWQLWTVKRDGFDPTLWFLVFAGEQIAGYALCTREQEEAWVGELGVRRPWRKHGLGLALLHCAFGEFYRRGDRRVVLNVDSENLTGATRLYRRAGMHPFEQTDIYLRELRAGIELSTQELQV